MKKGRTICFILSIVAILSLIIAICKYLNRPSYIELKDN